MHIEKSIFKRGVSMKLKETLLIAHTNTGAVCFKVYVKINIFTYAILEQVYYTKTKSGVVAFNSRFTNVILDIITTDPYYTGCRHCKHFKQCLTQEYNGTCERGLIGGVF